MKILNCFYQLIAFLIIASMCISCTPKQMTKEVIKKDADGFSPTFSVPKVDATFYEDCIRKFKTRNPDSIITTELIKFRYSYLAYKKKTGIYVPSELEKDFGLALREETFKMIEEIADKILEIDFTDIRVHMFKAYAMKANGKDFEFHKVMLDRLEQSILSTGDGRSPETAFHVAQVKEEYAILNAFGLQLISQSLSSKGNHSFDVMECQSKDGNVYKIYFDITEHMKSISEIYGK